MLQQTVLAYQDKTQIGAQPGEFLVIGYQGKETKLDLTDCLARNITSLRIGRADDNKIIIPNPVVNFYHATLQHRKDGWYIIDGQDRNQPGIFEPSTNGLFTNDKRRIDKEHKLDVGDRIYILAAGEFTVTFSYYNLGKAATKIQPVSLDDKKEVTIGRNPANDLVLPDLTVSSLHATIKLEGNQRVLIHMSHVNPSVVGNTTLTKPGARHPIKPGDTITIGPFSIFYDGHSLKPPSGAVGLGPRVDALNVTKKVLVRPGIKDIFLFRQPLVALRNIRDLFLGRKKTLIENITLPIQPGEFVALVGGSGTGKSTLLKSMIGILDTESGSKILINNQDLFANFNRYRSAIGYVPQEDIIHDDLTVEQVLSYAIRLRKSATRKNRKKWIDEILVKLQLIEQRANLVRNLSGGQKKRLNVAVELAANPSILVLDEPTSGLDPGLDKELMNELARLAHEELKTIILVTHTTENIEKCDKIAFLCPGNKQVPGGHLAFYGSPAEAIDFFEVEKFPDIYSKLNRDAEKQPLYWSDKYRHSNYYQQHIGAYLQPPQLPGQTHEQGPSSRTDFLENLRQILILSERYIQNNALTLALLLVIPVLLTLLFYIVAGAGLFQKVMPDLKDLAEFKGVPKEQLGRFIFSTRFFANFAKIEQVIFMLSTVAVFLGLFGSFQEIVKERPIYERERLVNLSIPAYVLSKFFVLATLAILQAIVMIFILDMRVDIIKQGWTWMGARWEAVISLFLVIISAVALGLLVSALVNRKRDRTVIILVFLVTIQILFSGAIFNLGDSDWLAWFTSTRWGTETLGSAIGISLEHEQEMVQDLVNRVQGGLRMDYGDLGFLLGRWGILIGYTLVFLILTMLVLWMQDTVRKRTQKAWPLKIIPAKKEK